MKTSRLALAALLLAAGCGRVITVDDRASGPDGGLPDTFPDATFDTGTPDVPDAFTPDVVTPSEAGACAGYTPGFDAVPNGNHIGAGPPGCRVAIGVHSQQGSRTLDFAVSAVGDVDLTGDTLRISCGEPGNTSMTAVIDCYRGPGSYAVRPGALVLGGKSSDRICTLQVDTTQGELRGAIDCETNPDDPTNVFANTMAPYGLGVYFLPYP
jgi:hypothetical protein